MSGEDQNKCEYLKFDASNADKKEQNSYGIPTNKLEKYKCDLCDSEFSLRPSLYRHKKAIHLMKRKYCDKCDKSFTTSDYLKLHISNVHENRRFDCSICEKSFTSLQYLKKHTLFSGQNYY